MVGVPKIEDKQASVDSLERLNAKLSTAHAGKPKATGMGHGTVVDLKPSKSASPIKPDTQEQTAGPSSIGTGLRDAVQRRTSVLQGQLDKQAQREKDAKLKEERAVTRKAHREQVRAVKRGQRNSRILTSAQGVEEDGLGVVRPMAGGE